jgi:hypothetical protein
MSRLFQPIPAKPAFGVLKKNFYASDYIQNKKLKQAFSYSIKNKTRTNLSQSQLMNLKNCELFNSMVYNKVDLDNTELISGLYSKENLNGVVCICIIENNVNPKTGLPKCDFPTVIDVAKQPFYTYYNIDPTGYLFGNTECGLNNYTNYMQITKPSAKSTSPLSGCIQTCISNADKICANVCH